MMNGATYDERTRKETIMREVLPDEAMWKAWEKTEAPLRKGRGWYPALDKRFLELLVETEIDLHSLSLASSNGNPPVISLDRFERNREKVRRVAQSRIGQERLDAYCDRVKEAFDAYIRGGLWNLWDEDGGDVDEDATSASGALMAHDAEAEFEGEALRAGTASVEEGERQVSTSILANVGAGSKIRGRDRAPKSVGRKEVESMTELATDKTPSPPSDVPAADTIKANTAMAHLAVDETPPTEREDTDVYMGQGPNSNRTSSSKSSGGKDQGKAEEEEGEDGEDVTMQVDMVKAE